jgi:hypothetical protein
MPRSFSQGLVAPRMLLLLLLLRIDRDPDLFFLSAFLVR